MPAWIFGDIGWQSKNKSKKFEKIYYLIEFKVGSLGLGCYSKNDSRTLRLTKSVCKSVNERGWEKSWCMVSFAIFLKKCFNAKEIPLYPFLGNRINIIFLSGTGFF